MPRAAGKVSTSYDLSRAAKAKLAHLVADLRYSSNLPGVSGSSILELLILSADAKVLERLFRAKKKP